MIGRFVEWILDRVGERHEIARPGDGKFLTRWMLCGKRYEGTGSRLMVHKFHRSDAEPYFHDHPFAFWSLILWGGYYEHTATGKVWCGPLSFLRRPAEWKHRVELPPGRTCWTLVWRGPRVRSWGFWCREDKWIPWREHEANVNATGTGCPE
jgi:hypothetical protein